MAKALDFPFRVENGAIATTTDYRRVVWGQLIDAVATNYRERLMNPTWGADVQSLVFDPSDELRRSDAAGVIGARLMQMVTKANILKVEILPDQNDPSLVYVEIGYQPSDYDDPETLIVPVNVDYTGLPAVEQNISG
jgi:phage baseplate assembly protein W